MSGIRWKRLIPAELPLLEAFLRSREEEAAGFIGKILRDGRLRIPASLSSALLIAVDGGIVIGAILRTSGGVVFPLLPEGRGGRKGPTIPSCLGEGLASVVGAAPDVLRFENAVMRRPIVAVSYELMCRRFSSGQPEVPPSLPGMHIGRAGVEDLDDLMPLQEAYEKEEVLTAIHRFDGAGSKAGLVKALREQLLFIARLDGGSGGLGNAIAKAATNARAFTLDQIGGVFVAPPYRRRGIGEAVVSKLLDAIAAEGRDAVLFVKDGNEAARALYDSLGFEPLGPYRADYFIG